MNLWLWFRGAAIRCEAAGAGEAPRDGEGLWESELHMLGCFHLRKETWQTNSKQGL